MSYQTNLFVNKKEFTLVNIYSISKSSLTYLKIFSNLFSIRKKKISLT